MLAVGFCTLYSLSFHVSDQIVGGFQTVNCRLPVISFSQSLKKKNFCFCLKAASFSLSISVFFNWHIGRLVCFCCLLFLKCVCSCSCGPRCPNKHCGRCWEALSVATNTQQQNNTENLHTGIHMTMYTTKTEINNTNLTQSALEGTKTQKYAHALKRKRKKKIHTHTQVHPHIHHKQLKQQSQTLVGSHVAPSSGSGKKRKK